MNCLNNKNLHLSIYLSIYLSIPVFCLWPLYQPYSQKLTQFSPNNCSWTTWNSLTFLLVNWVRNTSKTKRNSLCAMLVTFNLLKTKLEKKIRQIIFAFALKLQISLINYSYIFFFEKGCIRNFWWCDAAIYV